MNKSENHFDVVVIGSGPGGEGAAIMLAKSGKKVAIIEKYCMVGGGCTHWGTIPSKTFIHVIRQFAEQKSSSLYSCVSRQAAISADDLMTAVNNIIDQQVTDRAGFYQNNGIEVIQGFARFADPHTIEIGEADGVCRSGQTGQRVTADYFVIASGTHPYRPDDVDFTSPAIADSDTILQLKRLPEVLTVYGAGVVGSEYASAFSSLGINVNLVDSRTQILEFLDDEISTALRHFMVDEQGIQLWQGEEYQRVETDEAGVALHLKSGRTVRSDLLLWANGRTGNTAGMNLEILGIKPDHRCHIAVNSSYQTIMPHIYAVGDIIGFPNLASAAYDQGRFAACHIIKGHCDAALVKDIPTGIYTLPEISCVGMTEQELQDKGIPYLAGRSEFGHVARGQISDHKVGMLKLLFHRETLAILGVHCFGHNAADLLHLGQAIMAQPEPLNSVEYFINTTFNYPTMAEAYRVAALNGYNKL